MPGTNGDLSSSSGPYVPLGLARERWSLKAAGLPPVVIDTIQNARGSSTRTLYSSNLQIFEEWWQNRGTIPFQYSVVEVLCFRQDLVGKGKVFSTVRVYLVAISVCHVGLGKRSKRKHPLVRQLMRGACCKIPVTRPPVPLWDFLLVLDALTSHPFEPIKVVDLKMLRSTFLTAVTSMTYCDFYCHSIGCISFSYGSTKCTCCYDFWNFV